LQLVKHMRQRDATENVRDMSRMLETFRELSRLSELWARFLGNLPSRHGKGSTAANGLPAGIYSDTYYRLQTCTTSLSIQSTEVDCDLSRSLAPADWIRLHRGGPPEVPTGLDRTSRSDPVCSPGRTVRNTVGKPAATD
jgi:hypothetical protein